MLKTLRFAVIAEADRHTHYLYPSGRLERVVKGELQHGPIGVIGHLLTGQQVTIINRLCNQAQRDKGRTWTALRKAVEAEMAKPGSRDWSTVCDSTHTLYKLGPSRSMDDFPLKEPK